MIAPRRLRKNMMRIQRTLFWIGFEIAWMSITSQNIPPMRPRTMNRSMIQSPLFATLTTAHSSWAQSTSWLLTPHLDGTIGFSVAIPGVTPFSTSFESDASGVTVTDISSLTSTDDVVPVAIDDGSDGIGDRESTDTGEESVMTFDDSCMAKRLRKVMKLRMSAKIKRNIFFIEKWVRSKL